MKKLLPMPVPWMISPSKPNLKLIVTEDEKAQVQFVGFFGFEKNIEVDEKDKDQILLFDNVGIYPNIKFGRYQMISMNFSNIGWIKRTPQYSEREVVDETIFDWSDVGGRKLAQEDIAAWRNKFMQTWSAERVCPNPSFYLVENSDWISQSEMKKWGLKHYLILGESSSIEILAQAYDWDSKGSMIEW